MWPLAVVALTTCIALALRLTRHAAVSLRISRWTYGLVMPLSLLYFPIKAGFHVRPVQCEWTFDLALAIDAFRNIPHTVGFVIFFLWSICLVMGFLVEIAEGATGIHNCRMRDLIPDMAGTTIGCLVFLAVCAVKNTVTSVRAVR